MRAVAPAIAGAIVLATTAAAPSAAGTATPPPRIQERAIGIGRPPLAGTLTLPAGKGPFPAVVLLAGSGPVDQDETIGADKPFRDLARDLAARGVASVRFDKRFRDYPKSVDPRTTTVMDEYVPDALAAIRLLRHTASVDARSIYVLGHSLGGRLAPLVAKRAGSQVKGVILAAAMSEPFGASILRQYRYLATLPGEIGAAARAALSKVEQLAAQLDSPELARLDPATLMYGGVGPAYWLSLQRYDEVATARALRQPLLLLQGDRDYEVTVRDDLSLWLKGLAGRKGVKVVRFPHADHFFIDGTGPSSPLDYKRPAHVDPNVAATIARWISS